MTFEEFMNLKHGDKICIGEHKAKVIKVVDLNNSERICIDGAKKGMMKRSVRFIEALVRAPKGKTNLRPVLAVYTDESDHPKNKEVLESLSRRKKDNGP